MFFLTHAPPRPANELTSFSAFVSKTKKCGGHASFPTSIMPPDRYSSREPFDIDLLYSRALHPTTLRAIEKVCYRSDPEIAEIIAALDDRRYLLEYIISGTLSISFCASPTLIALRSSAGGGRIPEAPNVDTYRISHISNAKSYGHHEYAAPRQVIIFVAFCGVSIRFRCTPQPPRTSKKGGTFFQCSQGSSGKRRYCSDG